jgi:hypothetical protein
MPAIVTSAAVEDAVRSALLAEGWVVSTPRRHGEAGADIEAVREGKRLCVEAIAFKSSGPARAKDFYEAFFRAASRVGPSTTRVAIALPARFAVGLPQRVHALGHAWRRIGEAFPELEIWLVETVATRIRQTSWNEWAHKEPSTWPSTASIT